MLSSSMLREEVDVIIDLVAQSKIEEAKQRLQLLAPQVSSEYGKGAILALNGLLSSKKGVDNTLDTEKTMRTLDRLVKVQTTDDMDRGYAQTMGKWARKAPKPQAQGNESRG